MRRALLAGVLAALVAALGVVAGLRPLSAHRTEAPTPTPSPATHAVRQSPRLLVALGDSVVSGGPCDCWTFPRRLARILHRRVEAPVSVRNLGVGGTTSADLLATLRPGGTAAGQLRGADIVTVTIGANDMVAPRSEWLGNRCRACFDRTADRVSRNLTEILRRVRAEVGERSVRVLVTTYWNVFREPRTAAAADAQDSEYDVMARRATLLTNAAICDAAAREAAACVDLFRPFKGDGTRDVRDLLEPDRDHPNAAGHQLIAEALAAAS